MRKYEDTDGVEWIERQANVRLLSKDTNLDLGDYTLSAKAPQGPQTREYADAAFKKNRASLNRLMPQAYTLEVREEDRSPQGFALTGWVKLVDKNDEFARWHENYLKKIAKSQRERSS